MSSFKGEYLAGQHGVNGTGTIYLRLPVPFRVRISEDKGQKLEII